MLHSKTLSKNNVEDLFSSLAKKYQELGGREPVNLIVVGGAAILTRFNFRAMTLDVDALYPKTELFLEATRILGEEENLPKDWINDEFVTTPSYSDVIFAKAQLYKSFGDGIINLYRLPDPFLIAMKMKSGRPTSGDLDDVIRMVAELKHEGKDASFDEIELAHKELYGIGFDLSSTLFVSELKKVTSMSKTEIDEWLYPPFLD